MDNHRTQQRPHGRVLTADHRRAMETADTFTGLPTHLKRFDLFRMVRTAARPLGLGAPEIEHLEMLFAYTKENDWHGCAAKPIVWLSAQETARRLGVCRQQVSRRERRLVELGLVVHRDSGNHRRFGSRKDGQVVDAYGIDLRPLGARWRELEHLADRVREEQNEWYRWKCKVSALRRQVRGLLDGASSSVARQWNQITEAPEVVARLRPNTDTDTLKRFVEALERWVRDLMRELDRLMNREVSPKSATAGEMPRKTRHKDHQNATQGSSKRDTPYDYKHIVPNIKTYKHGHTRDDGSDAGRTATDQPENKPLTTEKDRADPVVAQGVAEGVARVVAQGQSGGVSGGVQPDNPRLDNTQSVGDVVARMMEDRQKSEGLIQRILQTFPAFVRIKTPEELTHVVERLRGSYGVSPDAWGQACQRMGRTEATVALAVAMTKADKGQVANVGGYLRGLTKQHQKGALNLEASVMGMIRAIQSPGEEGGEVL